MKMKQEHYDFIKEKIDKVIDENPGIQSKYKEAGLSDKRLRWDCIWSSIDPQWICDNLYEYLDDTHIDTALRKITNTK